MLYDELPPAARTSYRLDQLIHESRNEMAPESPTEADIEMLYEMRGLTLIPNDCACCGEEIPDGTRTAGSEMCDECYAQIWEDQADSPRDFEADSWGHYDEDYEARKSADRYESIYTGM